MNGFSFCRASPVFSLSCGFCFPSSARRPRGVATASASTRAARPKNGERTLVTGLVSLRLKGPRVAAPVGSFLVQGKYDRHLHVRVDAAAAALAGLEFPFADRLDGGRLELALRGAEGVGVLDVAVLVDDEVDHDFAGDAGAAHLERILRSALHLGLRRLVELVDVEHLHAAELREVAVL